MHKFLFILFTGFSFAVCAQERIVFMKPSYAETSKTLYVEEILTAALEASVDEFGHYQLMTTFSTANSERTKLMLIAQGGGDITFAATTQHWEQVFIPIRVPIYKGLQGKRVLVINKQDQPKFSAVSSLKELTQFSLGSLKIWQITNIFHQNGFNVVTGSGHWSMFSMLAKERFDFLPRGVYEVEDEFKLMKKKHPSLYIEETILLNVPMPAYFFVNPEKPVLAKRLTAGLALIIKNGTFNLIFDRYFKEVLVKLNFNKRKVFNISNDTLSETSAENAEQFWTTPLL